MPANTLVCGTSGGVSIANRGARIASWSADLIHEVYDCTGYSSGGFRQNKGGLKSVSGSARGWLTKGSATTDQPNYAALAACDDGVAIVLSADTGCTYSFTGNVSNMRIDHAVDGIPTIVFNFVSNGTITEAWVTA